ncbi:MAG: excinuclease ABC subunit UvrC [Candidatus Omnitrophota bacterium]
MKRLRVMPAKKKRKLQNQLPNLPSSPGIYLFRDKAGHIIYVGKAVNLRNRVRSYFQENYHPDPKISFLTGEIADIEYFVTGSEAEAFFLESRFIKAYQPRYNVEQRDDKTFPFVRITKEPFPGITIVRGQKEKDAYYFGPFTQVWALRRAVRNLRRIFPLVGCRRKINVNKPGRPCLDYRLKRCLAPCTGKISREDYNRVARAMLAFFQGKNIAVINELRNEMEKSAEELDFEKAALLRDEIEVLQRVQRHPKALGKETPTQKTVLNLKKQMHLGKEPVRIEAYDISNLFGEEAVGSMVTFLAGEPYRKGYRRFRIKSVTGIDDCGMLSEVLRRRLTEKAWSLPDLILVDGGRGQAETAYRTLAASGIKIPVVGLAKKEEQFFVPGNPVPLPIAPNSPEGLYLRRVRDEAHRFAISYHRKLRNRKAVASSLDSVPGIGPKRKEILWRLFPSLEAIKSAPLEKLVELGIPRRIAEKLIKPSPE